MAQAGQADRIKAYTIGVEVYARDQDFDPQQDNIVRINAGRVRKKLNEYYHSPQGSQQPVHIILPERSYAPEFIFNPLNVDPVSDNNSTSDKTPITYRQPARKGVKVALFSAVLLIGFALTQWLSDEKKITRTFKPKPPGNDYFINEAWTDALAHYQQAVQQTPNNSLYWRQLGRSYSHLDKHKQAQKALEKALAIDTQDTHQSVDIAEDWYYLGVNLARRSEFDQAHRYFVKALSMAQTMAPKAPDLWKYHNQLAVSYSSQNYFEEALIQLDFAFSLVLGVNANKEAQRRLYATRGSIKKRQGRYIEAAADFKIALDLSIANYGKQHIKVARQYNNMGVLYVKTGQFGQSLTHYKKALAIYRAVYGDTHTLLANTYSNIAVALMEQEKYTQAQQQLQQAININQSVNAGKNIKMAINLYNLAEINRRQGKPHQSLDWYNQALMIYIDLLGATHQYTAKNWVGLGDAYHQLGDVEKARQYYLKALPIYRRVFGNDHKETLALTAKINA